MSETLRVWVGCLACYNSGRLHGAWEDAQDAVAWECDKADHEETWCFDSDTPWIQGECSPHEAGVIAEAVYLLSDDIPADVVREYLAGMNESVTTYTRDIGDSYRGEWDSWGDFANGLADELLGDVPSDSLLARYFDYEAFARDLAYDYQTVEHDGITYVFENN